MNRLFFHTDRDEPDDGCSFYFRADPLRIDYLFRFIFWIRSFIYSGPSSLDNTADPLGFLVGGVPAAILQGIVLAISFSFISHFEKIDSANFKKERQTKNDGTAEKIID